MLNKQEILGATDIRAETLAVPEWGGDVLVWGLTGTQRDAFEAALAGDGARGVNLADVRARLCALALRDANGERLFSDADVAELGSKSARALDRVFTVARRLSGLSDADVEELTKK